MYDYHDIYCTYHATHWPYFIFFWMRRIRYGNCAKNDRPKDLFLRNQTFTVNSDVSCSDFIEIRLSTKPVRLFKVTLPCPPWFMITERDHDGPRFRPRYLGIYSYGMNSIATRRICFQSFWFQRNWIQTSGSIKRSSTEMTSNIGGEWHEAKN